MGLCRSSVGFFSIRMVWVTARRTSSLPISSGFFASACRSGGRCATKKESKWLPEDLVLYCGRHDYGTRILKRTGNLAAVMRTMGHRDVKTAMQYQHPELKIVPAALDQDTTVEKRA